MTARQRSGFRAALVRNAGLVLGTWIKLPATESVELMAIAGFDFVVIDLEHSELSLETAGHLIGTARLADVSPLVRIPGRDSGIVARVLDAGAHGIVAPHVEDADDALDLVKMVRFPPLGTRGSGATGRAGAWGTTDRGEYVRFGQEEVVIVAQIESMHAAARAHAIAAVAGVDAVLIGLADLALSAGLTQDAPAVKSAVETAMRASRQAGVPVGNSGDGTAGAVRQTAAAEYAFTLLGNDATLLGRAAREAVSTARACQGRGSERLS